MEHEIPFGNSNRENGPTFIDFPLFLGIFKWDEPGETCYIYRRTEILTKSNAPNIPAGKAKRTETLIQTL